jgi:hypothetical protein
MHVARKCAAILGTTTCKDLKCVSLRRDSLCGLNLVWRIVAERAWADTSCSRPCMNVCCCVGHSSIRASRRARKGGLGRRQDLQTANTRRRLPSYIEMPQFSRLRTWADADSRCLAPGIGPKMGTGFGITQCSNKEIERRRDSSFRARRSKGGLMAIQKFAPEALPIPTAGSSRSWRTTRQAGSGSWCD